MTVVLETDQVYQGEVEKIGQPNVCYSHKTFNTRCGSVFGFCTIMHVEFNLCLYTEL